MKSIKLSDAEKYSIRCSLNYGTDTFEKFKKNNDLDAIFIAITDPYGREECVALNVADAELLIKGLQSLIKVLTATGVQLDEINQ